MKKIIATFTLFLSLNNIWAQEIKNISHYLPEKDEIGLSFSAGGIFRYIGNAFNGNTSNSTPSLSSPIENTFVGKYFYTDKKAYRAVVNLAIQNETFSVAAQSVTEVGKLEQSKFDFAIGIGKEWRRSKTKIQGFYGADILLTASKAYAKQTETKIATGITKTIEFNQGLIFGVGAAGFIGIEYFFYPKVSMVAQYTYTAKIEPKSTFFQEATETGKPNTKIEFSNNKLLIGGVSVASLGVNFYF